MFVDVVLGGADGSRNIGGRNSFRGIGVSGHSWERGFLGGRVGP